MNHTMFYFLEQNKNKTLEWASEITRTTRYAFVLQTKILVIFSEGMSRLWNSCILPPPQKVVFGVIGHLLSKLVSLFSWQSMTISQPGRMPLSDDQSGETAFCWIWMNNKMPRKTHPGSILTPRGKQQMCFCLNSKAHLTCFSKVTNFTENLQLTPPRTKTSFAAWSHWICGWKS